jgi:T5SS/PEP-CTERM-associated repeat protein
MYRKNGNWKFAICLTCTCMLAASPLRAAELTWTGNGGVFFDNAGNWNPAQSPTAADNLTFAGSASAYSLILAGTPVANEMRFLGGTYTMEGGGGSNLSNEDTWIDGGTLTATGSNTAWGVSDDIIVGDLTTGTLNVEDQSLVTHRGIFLGNSALGQGTVNVSGSGTTLGTSQSTSIGRIGVNGTGTMNVTGGARSDMSSALLGQFAGSTGTVNVDGVGSTFVTHNFDMRAGDAGNGHINVTQGGRILATGNGNLIAGNVAGSDGTITLNGGIADVGSRIYVGKEGTGTFTATNGSTVNSNFQFRLGDGATGSGTATFDNSTLTIDDSIHDLIVGWSGQGQMFLQNGASANVPNDVFIGYETVSTGDNRLEITGGSSLNFGNNSDDDLNVGHRGNGTLIVNDGSTVSGYFLSAGAVAGSTGNVTIDGSGTTANLQSLFAGNSGTGDVTVSGGAQMNLQMTGSTTANLTVGDSDVGVGTLTITGTNGTGTASTVTANRRAEIGGSNNESGGTGTLNIEAGGRLVTAGGVIGLKHANVAGAGGVGVVNVTGAGSRWESNAGFTVGDNGQGDLNVTAGGYASTTSSLVVGNGNTADDGTANVLVSGAGGGTPSTIDIQTQLRVGDDRAATMRIEDGAIVNSAIDGAAHAYIGNASSADGAEVIVDGATWNQFGARIRVGNNGGSAAAPSTLSVLNAGTVQNSGFLMIADTATSSHGLVEVIGNGSNITSTFGVVGDAGTGTINVLGGGVVTMTESLDIAGTGSGRGTVLVSGTGSRLDVSIDMSVGRDNGSIGALTIAAGGSVNSAEFRVAESAGSTGTVNVQANGTLSPATGSNMYVGGSSAGAGGNGILNVSGGTVDVFDDEISVYAGGTVNLSAGTLATSGVHRIGNGKFNFTGGTLSLKGNQVVDQTLIDNIFNDSSTGTSNASLDSGMTLQIGGTAALDAPLQLRGGSFSVGSINNLANLDWDAGTFQLTSANVDIGPGGIFGDQLLLNSAQSLVVNQTTTNNGLINATGSTLNFAGGLTNNADMVLIDSVVSGDVNTPGGSTVTVVGAVSFMNMVSGAGNFYGPGTANFIGGYGPGDSPAIVSFEGALSLNETNTLFMEIGGNDNSVAAQYDQLLVAGMALVDGALDVSLIDLGGGTYAPQQGDSFAILSASGGLDGTFSNLNLPTLSSGLSWQLNPGGSTLFLNVIGGQINGDFDGDGDWDGDDVDSLVMVVAAMSNNPLFDLNGDGNVDGADLQDWLAEAGATNLASGNPYIVGDANLDGSVDGQDFIAWNSAKFTATARWTAGDFTADGFVDGIDFIEWNTHKFTSSDGFANAVPEPHGLVLWLVAMAFAAKRRRR